MLTFLKRVCRGLISFHRAFNSARENPNWHILEEAKPTVTHPFGGFWKRKNQSRFGLAIGPAQGAMYFFSFCGPGGCSEKEQFRPFNTIVDNPDFKIIDENTIEMKGRNGFVQYVRSEWPEPS
jgi:hypothetical protein